MFLDTSSKQDGTTTRLKKRAERSGYSNAEVLEAA
jgi:hypothetical protein